MLRLALNPPVLKRLSLFQCKIWVNAISVVRACLQLRCGKESLPLRANSIKLWGVTVLNLNDQKPFTTKDGSQIRSILDLSNAPVQQQSLAEAQLPEGAATDRHYHLLSEEFYFMLEGRAEMEIDGEKREVREGDAILIPAGAWHQIRAVSAVRFLCCCAPPYRHEDTYFS